LFASLKITAGTISGAWRMTGTARRAATHPQGRSEAKDGHGRAILEAEGRARGAGKAGGENSAAAPIAPPPRRSRTASRAPEWIRNAERATVVAAQVTELLHKDCS